MSGETPVRSARISPLLIHRCPKSVLCVDAETGIPGAAKTAFAFRDARHAKSDHSTGIQSEEWPKPDDASRFAAKGD